MTVTTFQLIYGIIIWHNGLEGCIPDWECQCRTNAGDDHITCANEGLFLTAGQSNPVTDQIRLYQVLQSEKELLARDSFRISHVMGVHVAELNPLFGISDIKQDKINEAKKLFDKLVNLTRLY